MSKWKQVSDFVNFSIKGITPKYVENSSIIVLNQKCIRNGKIDYSLSQFTDDTKQISEAKFVKRGDILINSTGTGTAGRCAFVKELPEYHRLITDSHILLLRCNTYNEAQCLSYLLFSFEKTLMSFMTGSSGQSELDKMVLLNLKTKLPTDPYTQQKIAKVLSDLDSKIELNNRINTELEAMAKMLYDYWFVQFDFPDANGKPYKTSGGKMVWNEELKREIPVGWEDGIISDLFNLNPTLSLKKGALSSYIDMNALPTNGFMTKAVQEKEFNGGVKFQNGDVIIARITPCLENGKTGLITLLKEKEIGYGSTEFIVLRGKNMSLSCFGAFLSRSELFRKYAIANMLGTSGRKRVESTKIGTFPIALPSEAILKRFEKTISAQFKQATINTKENQELVSLRDWLLPMMMNGQVSVGDVEEELGMVAEDREEYK